MTVHMMVGRRGLQFLWCLVRLLVGCCCECDCSRDPEEKEKEEDEEEDEEDST